MPAIRDGRPGGRRPRGAYRRRDSHARILYSFGAPTEAGAHVRAREEAARGVGPPVVSFARLCPHIEPVVGWWQRAGRVRVERARRVVRDVEVHGRPAVVGLESGSRSTRQATIASSWSPAPAIASPRPVASAPTTSRRISVFMNPVERIEAQPVSRVHGVPAWWAPPHHALCDNRPAGTAPA